MKIKEWAEKTGVTYLTAYRWFKAGTLPVKAYQTDSGTIIVEDPEFSENEMVSSSNNNQSNDVLSAFLKKTVEFSKNNSSIEDFAAYVLSNFQLKLNSSTIESPKYSRNKPKSEDIQKHFQQFIKPKGDKPALNMFIAEPETIDQLVANSDQLTSEELIEEIGKIGAGEMTKVASKNFSSVGSIENTPEYSELIKGLTQVWSPTSITANGTTSFFGNPSVEGIVSRSVDLTPQLYTNSTIVDNTLNSNSPAFGFVSNQTGPTGAFAPTQKEIEQASKTLQSASPPKKRGRKPSKKANL